MRTFKRYILLWTLAFVLCLLLLEVMLGCCGLVLRSYVKLFCVGLTATGIAAGLVQCILRISSIRLRAVLLILYAVLLLAGGYFGVLLTAFFYVPDHTVVRNGTAYAAEEHSLFAHGWTDYYEAKNLFLRGNEICFTEDWD